jgi:hypothetical protein
VAFTAHGAPGGNKKRRAAGVLVVGEYYKGVLMSLRPGGRYGWLRLQDSLGNPHLVYLRVNSNAEGHKDVTRAEEDEAARPRQRWEALTRTRSPYSGRLRADANDYAYVDGRCLAGHLRAPPGSLL